jgi:hypothetical protein
MGFRLPALFFDELRLLQPTDPALRPSSDYFAEVIKERLALPYETWTLAARSSRRLAYRSAYLDLLRTRLEKGSWQELGSARRHSIKTLDPAFMRYLDLPFVANGARWQDVLDANRAELDAEAVALSTRYSNLWELSRDVTASGTRKVMAVVLGDVGFSIRRDVPRGTIIFSRKLALPDVLAFCSLGDPLQMKRGLWSLAMGFCSPNDSFETLRYDSVLLLEGLAFWLPGGEGYLRHDGSPSRIVLGITVCAALLDLLSRQFDSV